jgi:phosphonate transport system substrate-binding protein
VLDYSVYETEKKAGNVDENKVRVIWETPPYTDYHFSIRGDVDAIFGAGFKEKVRRILAQFDRSSFIAAKNDDFNKIEEIAYTLELLN